ncbi:MAG: hypothetical protein R3282_01995, partial [Rhodothermales bacterium]|nr:hypothetical protein [Rhodothermales bacterium]
MPSVVADAKALSAATRRGVVRRLARGVYTNVLEGKPEHLIAAHLPAILAGLYPEWYLSHSTAATLRAVDGVAFISGDGRRTPIRFLPGVTVKRVRPHTHPELVTIEVDTLVARRVSDEPVPARVRLSSPLQVVFELLSPDRRQPERTLPDDSIAALVENLPDGDLNRAEA